MLATSCSRAACSPVPLAAAAPSPCERRDYSRGPARRSHETSSARRRAIARSSSRHREETEQSTGGVHAARIPNSHEPAASDKPARGADSNIDSESPAAPAPPPGLVPSARLRSVPAEARLALSAAMERAAATSDLERRWALTLLRMPRRCLGISVELGAGAGAGACKGARALPLGTVEPPAAAPSPPPRGASGRTLSEPSLLTALGAASPESASPRIPPCSTAEPTLLVKPTGSPVPSVSLPLLRPVAVAPPV